MITYVVSTTPRSIRQLLRTPQHLVEPLTLLLRTRILPIRTERMTERPLTTTLKLFNQRLARVKTRKQRFCIFAPKHCPMLHPRPTNSLDFRKVRSLLFQTRQDEFNGFEEQCCGGEDLALGGVGEDAFFNAIFEQVGVKVDFGFVDEFEVRANDDAWNRPWRVSKLLMFIVG